MESRLCPCIGCPVTITTGGVSNYQPTAGLSCPKILFQEGNSPAAPVCARGAAALGSGLPGQHPALPAGHPALGLSPMSLVHLPIPCVSARRRPLPSDHLPSSRSRGGKTQAKTTAAHAAAALNFQARRRCPRGPAPTRGPVHKTAVCLPTSLRVEGAAGTEPRDDGQRDAPAGTCGRGHARPARQGPEGRKGSPGASQVGVPVKAGALTAE